MQSNVNKKEQCKFPLEDLCEQLEELEKAKTEKKKAASSASFRKVSYVQVIVSLGSRTWSILHAVSSCIWSLSLYEKLAFGLKYYYMYRWMNVCTRRNIY